MRHPPRFLLWLLPPALLSCVVAYEAKRARGAAGEAAPRPTVNHALHAARDLLCTDCHDPEETGEPSLPAPSVCLDCHDDLDKEGPRVRAYFDAARQPDGTYRFARPAYMGDLVVEHKRHAGAKVDCAECHGAPAEHAFARPEPLAFMTRCTDCHAARGAPAECATCHREARKDVRPASHDEAFRAAHGKLAPPGWREGEGASCAICHAVPQDCHACHARTKPEDHGAAGFERVHGRAVPAGWREGEAGRCGLCHEVPVACDACHTTSKPSSHRAAGFRFHHGTGDTDALDGPFARTSCALCHEEQACQRCHAREEPRSHTQPFKRRLHGIAASIERQSCVTCHKQDWCASCHQTTRPVDHRGSFGTGRQTHCLSCHEPLPSTGCYACHKSTLGHNGHAPPPMDAVHLGASDPADCESCHLVLPHLNDGGRCRRCHR